MTRDQEKRRDNFMRLARMANVVPVDHFYVTDVFLEKFAEMIAAEEREACAKLCEKEQFELTQDVSGKNGLQHFDAGCRSCAEMIRARGEA
jgi:hypothetical protein